MSQARTPRVLVVGGGLAGSEAAMYLARQGIPVALRESKQLCPNPAQKGQHCAELVCTNSLKSQLPGSAHGLLKYEMRGLGSLVLEKGEQFSVPAGDALAVDREAFSQAIHKELDEHPLIDLAAQVVDDPVGLADELGAEFIVLATGPLTLPELEEWIQRRVALSEEDFYFYDAIAPIVDGESLDFERLYFKDRHRELPAEGEADYLNIPLTKEEYEHFVDELVAAKKVPPQDFEEERYFEACLPVDLMAERGRDTPRFSCMKPIGLERPEAPAPYACVQLRRENLLGSAYNMVGFQNRLTFSEQVRVFRQLPGMQEASFLHLGSVHRNTFINARKLLHPDMSSRLHPRIHFAGQICGVEGYTESASMGLYVASQIARKLAGKEPLVWPETTGIGALVRYVMTVSRPEPSSINFGLLPPVEMNFRRKGLSRGQIKKRKKELAAERAREHFDRLKAEQLR